MKLEEFLKILEKEHIDYLQKEGKWLMDFANLIENVNLLDRAEVKASNLKMNVFSMLPSEIKSTIWKMLDDAID